MSVSVTTTEGVKIIEGAKTWMTEGGCLKLFGPVNERNECLMEFSANYWLTVSQANGSSPVITTPAPAAVSPGVSAAPPPQATPTPGQAVVCEECKAAGLKNKKGYAPKFWPDKISCDGIVGTSPDGKVLYANHKAA